MAKPARSGHHGEGPAHLLCSTGSRQPEGRPATPPGHNTCEIARGAVYEGHHGDAPPADLLGPGLGQRVCRQRPGGRALQHAAMSWCGPIHWVHTQTLIFKQRDLQGALQMAAASRLVDRLRAAWQPVGWCMDEPPPQLQTLQQWDPSTQLYMPGCLKTGSRSARAGIVLACDLTWAPEAGQGWRRQQPPWKLLRRLLPRTPPAPCCAASCALPPGLAALPAHKVGAGCVRDAQGHACHAVSGGKQWPHCFPPSQRE